MASARQGAMLYPAQMAQPAPVKATSVLPTAALSQTIPEEVILMSLEIPRPVWTDLVSHRDHNKQSRIDKYACSLLEDHVVGVSIQLCLTDLLYMDSTASTSDPPSLLFPNSDFGSRLRDPTHSALRSNSLQ